MNEGLGRDREAACGQRAQRWWSGHRRRKARCTHEAEACVPRTCLRNCENNRRYMADGKEFADATTEPENGNNW